MFCASVIFKALHSLVTCYLSRRPARPGKGKRHQVCARGKQQPEWGGLRWETEGFSRPEQVARWQRAARAPAAVPGPANREAGGRGRGRPRRGGSRSSEVRSPRAGRAPLASRGHGAADLAFRRRRGRGRVPGVPEVRLRLGGARRTQAGPVPLAGGTRGRGGGRGQGPGALPPRLPESVPRLLREAYLS